MTTLRVGTRGSDLAVTQTRWLCDQLRAAVPGLEVEEIIIKTHGDVVQDRPFDADWPVGSFVSALEQALVQGEVDFAVHSYKDLPSDSPEPLVVAAIPPREDPRDVLVTREHQVDLDHLPSGFKIGTGSPRRMAQMRRLGDVVVEPIRGNVPTRLAMLDEGFDAVVLAAAGLSRLGIQPDHAMPLPIDRFVCSPAQGALAVQVRAGSEAEGIVRAVDDARTRRGVAAERAYMARIEAGCHTPMAAYGIVEDDDHVHLRAHLFSDDGSRLAEGEERGDDPVAVGQELGARLLAELGPR